MKIDSFLNEHMDLSVVLYVTISENDFSVFSIAGCL